MQPRKLAAIRQRRFAKWELKEFDYGDITAVIHETREAEEYYANKGWPVIDTTNLAVEETSSLVLDQLGLKNKIFN
jgi:regulator of PEP synthase PpsR (kinase-PPPase family)